MFFHFIIFKQFIIGLISLTVEMNQKINRTCFRLLLEFETYGRNITVNISEYIKIQYHVNS